MSAIIRFSDASTAELFADPAAGFRCGAIVRQGKMSERLTTDSHLQLVVSKGAATVVAGGVSHRLERHQAIVLPLGTDYEWQQDASTAAYYASLGQPVVAAGENEQVAVIRPGDLGELNYSAPPAGELLRGAIPDQLVKQTLVDTTRQWSAGYWESSGYYRITRPFSKHEFMLMLSGKLSLTCPGQEPEVFGPGEALVLPAGTVCDWDTPSMSKIYSSFVPAAS